MQETYTMYPIWYLQQLQETALSHAADEWTTVDIWHLNSLRPGKFNEILHM